jgi:hypothetical protein
VNKEWLENIQVELDQCWNPCTARPWLEWKTGRRLNRITTMRLMIRIRVKVLAHLLQADRVLTDFANLEKWDRPALKHRYQLA